MMQINSKKIFKTTLIFTILIVFNGVVKVYAQTNQGFENGLTGWVKTGKAGNLSIDKSNARTGKSCVQIGNLAGEIFQRINVAPLSILNFNGYVKASDSTIKVWSFVRFFDVHHKLLLTYKSGEVKSAIYKETGNYTETPPFSAYMEIGIGRDSSGKGFVYADDFKIETNVGEPKVKHKTLVNIDQYMRPFWKSDTIYNETVLLYSENGNAANGKLLFTPSKILAVKKFDLSTAYTQDVDYTINGNVITKLSDSKMPFRADTSFETKKDLEWFNLQSQWVVVTYTHHDKWDGPISTYKGDKIPLTIAKLKARRPVKIVALGMSITKGMDVSSYDDVPPYMPTYVNLFNDQLKKAYHYNDIELYNAGLPGSVVDWGAQYAAQYINPVKPDLVILDFGMNDFWRYTPDQFKGYIEIIIKKVKAGNPKAEFLLLSNMKFDPDYIIDSDKTKSWYLANMEGYSKVLQQMETKGIINLDMTAISDAIYQKKKAKDCIVNPLHPNDYMARWYAQGLAQLLIR